MAEEINFQQLINAVADAARYAENTSAPPQIWSFRSAARDQWRTAMQTANALAASAGYIVTPQFDLELVDNPDNTTPYSTLRTAIRRTAQVFSEAELNTAPLNMDTPRPIEDLDGIAELDIEEEEF